MHNEPHECLVCPRFSGIYFKALKRLSAETLSLLHLGFFLAKI